VTKINKIITTHNVIYEKSLNCKEIIYGSNNTL
jgi:hypothetical protein